jgi:RNA polymerase sigma-70 factor, ECF subfamily
MSGGPPATSVVVDPVDWGASSRVELLAQLRAIAVSQFASEHAGHTLQPTAVVHEAWLRIATKADGNFDTEAAFRQWAGNIVRQVLVDHARQRMAQKRDVRRRTRLIGHAPSSENGMSPEDLLTLSDLLDRLAATQPRMAAVIEMRYFGGMKDADIALRLGVSTRIVRADWHAARAWLYGKFQQA